MVHTWILGKHYDKPIALVGKFVNQIKPFPNFLEFDPPRTLELFATTPSILDFLSPRHDSTPWIQCCPIITLQTGLTCFAF